MPDRVSLELIASLRDEDLGDFLYRYANSVLEEHDDFAADVVRARKLLAKLPTGVRAGYTLVVLDSEVQNGGFLQWFTNSSGRFLNETLADLKRVGAKIQAKIVEKAIVLNNKLEARHPLYQQRWNRPEPAASREEMSAFRDDLHGEFEPELDRLTNQYYEVGETGSLWDHFVKYVRKYPEDCVHGPR